MSYFVILFLFCAAHISTACKKFGDDSPSLPKESPSILKESPSILKESPSLLKESPSLLKESPSLLKESLSLSKKSPSLSKGPPSLTYGSLSGPPPYAYLPTGYDAPSYRPRHQVIQPEQLPGAGTLDIYKNFNWTEVTPTSEQDLELIRNWNNSDWRVLDLVLIMDCTGSMSAWIEHSKTTLKSVIDDIIKENKNLKVRVAFVGFRDFGDGNNIFTIQDFSFDIPTVKNFISKQRASGGNDIPEDVTGGLHQTLQLAWYPGSVRLASIIADSPTHGKQYHDAGRDDHPEGSPAGVTLENLVKEFKEREIGLTLYKLTDKTEKMYDVIKNTYDLEDWVTFVDIREDIDQSLSEGLGYSSDIVATSYSAKSSEVLRHQYEVQSASKGWH